MLPGARGALSERVWTVLRGQPRAPAESVQAELTASARAVTAAAEPLHDEDLQLTLWALYELHYGGFEDVDDRWEWEPHLLAVRRELEAAFEGHVRTAVAKDLHRATTDGRQDLVATMFALAEGGEGPSVPRYARTRMTREQWDELLVLRSVSQLKEADPHSFAIPRLRGAPQVHLVEIQFDEYGSGRPERQHSRLYADAMAACGLDPAYGAYLDQVPAIVLAASNLVSLCALNRRLRSAAAGHLAMVETTSSLPCKHYVGGARRLGLPHAAWEYFDEHVEADAVHEQVAVRDLCAGIVEQDPSQLEPVLFGMVAGLYVEGLVGAHQLRRWTAGRSALRVPLPDRVEVPA